VSHPTKRVAAEYAEKRDPNVQLAGIKVSAARGIVSCKTMRMRAERSKIISLKSRPQWCLKIEMFFA
jgi:hypothetical protein